MFAVLFACALGLIAAPQVSGASEEFQLKDEVATPYSSSEIVNKHNDLRRSVQLTASNMMKMKWNTEAEANAQKWANTCSMAHSPASSREISTSGCGENLYMSSFQNSWSNVVQAWYNEVKDFQYGVGSINGGVVGHYTQVVWYNSNQIGCAMAYCPNSTYKYFYVCHYCPPGNYQLSRPYKSGSSCADCPSACENKLCLK
ncbi:cysteine-rich venom protein TEL1 [Oryzias melastigma]|uniref:cysteine-rich venom protein TEL1 n=1 Tax=Oryzias melastigma TaxID=30732 RepID=UPI000CF7BDAB|nr:cysteine-rich venom protein TEL1 [Oryzias melastigma]